MVATGKDAGQTMSWNWSRFFKLPRRKAQAAQIVCTPSRSNSKAIECGVQLLSNLLLTEPEKLEYGTLWLPDADVGCDGRRTVFVASPWTTHLVLAVSAVTREDRIGQVHRAAAVRGMAFPVAFEHGMADREVYSFVAPVPGWPEQTQVCVHLRNGTKLYYVVDNAAGKQSGPLPLFEIGS